MLSQEDHDGLPDQAYDALKLLAQGNPKEELAKAMGLTQGRIDVLLATIRKFTGERDLKKAVAKAQREGFLPRYKMPKE